MRPTPEESQHSSSKGETGPRRFPAGFEWVSDAPIKWRRVPVSAVFRRVKETDRSELPLLSVYRDHGVVLKQSRSDNHNKEGLDSSAYQVVQPGDLVVNKMKAWQGSLAVSELLGRVSPAYYVYRSDADIPSRFVHYQVRSQPYVSAYLAASKGVRVGQWDLDPTTFRRFPLLLPAQEMSARIADFLDRETERIDGLIEKKERLIALLEEKRAALITRAVTKGLDPNVPMKDSGVEWIGEIPEHWELRTLRTLVRMRAGKGITSADISDDGAFPVFGGNGVRGYSDEFTHEGERILIGRQGAQCGNIHVAEGRFWASEHAVVAEPLEPMSTHWLGAVLDQMNLNRYSVSAAQPGIAVDRIAGLPVPTPPLPEQTIIERVLSEEERERQALSRLLTRSSSLLRERRSALITAAVTGQIDIDEYEASQDTWQTQE